ncbi:APC family permease [Paraburkholderia lycopersici]|uniref:Amino acid transporter n=1 Tax=Paraburkholderia lycopersici TaxID=416944 RepID=A0A1G6LX78_9BURK|nr:APC family permease [Paraburkholderia lycopersici]SDC47873.1 Amino acid transporter [Paraburkholderia lycopersici]
MSTSPTELSGESGSLKKTFSSMSLFTLSFGVMVGSAWIVIVGDWFGKAGPLGAILGLSAAALMMCVVCLVYAELGARIPASGGEIVYTFEAFGAAPAYWVSWVYTIPALAFTAFEGIALTWMVATLVPGFGTSTLYHFLGFDVSAGQVTLGLVITALMMLQNYFGAQFSAGSQKLLTVAFLVVALVAIAVALSKGNPANITPLFYSANPNSHWWAGALAIFSSGLVWFSGFQAIPPVIEERNDDVSFARIARVMVISIIFAAVFYALVIVAVGMAQPWTGTLKTQMLTAAAFGSLTPGGWLAKVVLIAGAISIVKVWNGAFVWATRVILVQSRAQFLPRSFAKIHPKYGTPTRAVFLVGAINFLGIAAGPGAILPILDVAAICIGVVIASSPIVLLALKLRDRNGSTPSYETPGGIPTILVALLFTLALAIVACVQPFFETSAGLPLSWQILGAWLIVGLVRWVLMRNSYRDSSIARRALLGAIAGNS